MGKHRPGRGSDRTLRARLRRRVLLVLVTAALALAGVATATVASPHPGHPGAVISGSRSINQTTTTVSSSESSAPAAPSDSATTSGVDPTDLAVTQTATPKGVAVNGALTYTLTVTNEGPDAAVNAKVTDTLPTGAAYVGATDGCIRVERTVTCGPFNLDAKAAPVVYEIHVTVPDTPGTLTNHAEVTPGADQSDPVPGNNTSDLDTRVYDVDLSIQKLASSATVTAFSDVTYTIRVRNDGPQEATAIVTDRLPAYVTFKSADPACAYDTDARMVTCGGPGGWDVGPDGGTADFTVVVTAGAAGVRSNTASVTLTGSHLDRDPTDNSSTRDITVTDPTPGDERVLILDTTVSDGANSVEAKAARGLGYNVDVVTSAQWGAMTAADFARYRAIVLGDRTCASDYTAAEANALVWGSVVNGNVIINGTDPVDHEPGLRHETRVTDASVAFATAAAGKTGAYISLSCGAGGEPVDVLKGLGSFTTTHFSGNDVHIVASHPALTTLTDGYLSNWSSSVHESFVTWPDDYLVLAIVRSGSAFQAPDGSVGNPYMLAHSAGLAVISDIKLSPAAASKTVGESHTLTATVTQDGAPLAGKTVTFTIFDGPNKDLTSTAVTGADGTAAFTYSSSKVGTDKITASFEDSHATIQRSNQATATWTAAPPPPPPPAGTGGSAQGFQGKADIGVSVEGPTYARVGVSVTFTALVANGGPETATGVVLKTPVPAGATLDSISSTSGNGCFAGGTTCFLGTLAPGATATVTMVVTATQEGTLTVSVSAQGDGDPNGGNNASSVTVKVISRTAPPPPPPPSSQPGTFNAIGIGTFTVNGTEKPADRLFQLNSGDVVDATNGAVTFTGSDGSYLSVASSQFTARHTSGRTTRAAAGDVPAKFKVTQPATSGEITTLTLVGGDFASCAKSRSLSATDKHPVRQLWGSGKGKFRTQARFSAATVRGTVWLTQDRCDGSLTTVVEGVVDVFDKSLNKTVAVSAGQSYLAKPKGIFKPPATKRGHTQSAAAITRTGLVWAGRRFTSRAQFEEWLRARGRTWNAFKASYPMQAAALAARK